MSKSNKIITLFEKLARKEEISKIKHKSGCYKALWKTRSILGGILKSYATI